MGQDHAEIGARQPPAVLVLGREIAEVQPERVERQVGEGKAGAGVEEEQPRCRDDDRHDHRRDQDRHDRAAIGHFRPRQTQRGHRAQRRGNDGGEEPDDHRVLRGIHPFRVLPQVRPPGAVAHMVGKLHPEGQQRVIPAQGVAAGLEGHHVGREGEIGLRIEAQRDHDQDWRDQEQQHQRADHAERVVPDPLQRRGVDRNGHQSGLPVRVPGARRNARTSAMRWRRGIIA